MAVCAVLTSSTAFAGGGGTKKDATIKVRNDTTFPSAAFVDPDPAKIAVLVALANPTEADIKTAGGQLVNAGATVPFKVAAGTYSLLAISLGGFDATTSVTIAKGKTKSYAFTNAAALVPF